jgi:hypothetical protein
MLLKFGTLMAYVLFLCCPQRTIGQVRPLLQKSIRVTSMNGGNRYVALESVLEPATTYTISLPGEIGLPGQVLSVQSMQGNTSQLNWAAVLTPQNGWNINGNVTTDAWDGNTGAKLGTISNQDLVIVSNALERLRISKNGNIGVATASPQSLFEVNGNADFNGSIAVGDQLLPGTMSADGVNYYPGAGIQKNVVTATSSTPRTIALLAQTIGTGKFDNRIMGGAFFAMSDASNTQALGQMRSLQSWSVHAGSGVLTSGWGSYQVVTNRNAGSIQNAYGAVSGVENGSTGTINKLHGHSLEIWNNRGGRVDTAFGLTVSVYNNHSSSSIGAVYGISIGKGLISTTNGTHFWRNIGTIDNSYGLYIDESIDVGINRFAIYSRSKSISRFSGAIEIGNIDNNAVELRLLEPSGGGTNFTGIKAPLQSTDIVWTLPAIAPTQGQVLTAGASIPTQLEWKSQSCLALSMTTTERDALSSPTPGLIIFNTDVLRHQGYNSRGWYDLY